jgi:ATP-dependent Clp protease, protease subunit
MNAQGVIKSIGERGIAICGPITDDASQLCIAQFLFLAQTNPQQPITLQIDSPGGPVTSSMAIVRMIDELSCPVCTFCGDHAGGTAAVILAHGTPGFRAASPSATFAFAPLFTDPERGYVETELSQLAQALVELLSADCNKHEQEVYSLFNTHSELTSSQAVELGLIDLIAEAHITPSTRKNRPWSERIRSIIRAAFAPRLPARCRRSQ